jgi:hypothetical protein
MILSEIDCWTGYKKQGTKKGKNGNRVNNCVKEDDSDSEKTNNASSRAVKLLQNLDIFTDADKITEIVNDMTLTDMLALDTAFQNQDLEYLEKLFNDITDTVESTLPGRSNVTSAASPVTAPTSAAVDLDDDEEEIEQPDEKTSIKPKSSDSTRGTTSPMSPGMASWKKREDQMEESYITRIKQLSGIVPTVDSSDMS